jgi:hypothetical protein
MDLIRVPATFSAAVPIRCRAAFPVPVHARGFDTVAAMDLIRVPVALPGKEYLGSISFIPVPGSS